MSKKTLEKLYFKAVNKVKAKNLIQNNISLEDNILTLVDTKYDLAKYSGLYIFSVGKASFSMAREVEKLLKDKITGGLAVCLEEEKLKYIDTFKSSHPLVTKRSFKAGNLLIEKMSSLNDKDLVLFFLSGGASAMVEKPIEGLSFNDFEKISTAVLKSGVDIKALNSVRKSISQIKGGKLASYTKAKCLTLVLSDVIGDDLNTIGSALMYDKKVPHYIIGNNKIALKEAKKSIKNKVEKTKIITTKLNKNTKSAAKYIKEIVQKYDNNYDSFALFFAGETTTKVKANGIGGRNQELALRLLEETQFSENISILCAGSDGIDGNSDSAGAFIDKDIYSKIKKMNLDKNEYLKNCDSNTFFKKLNYDFTIKATGTNVMDFIFVLKIKRS